MTKPEYDLKKVAKTHKKKLEKIKVFLLDVDGILTNGLIYYASGEVGFNRFFHAQDGFGIKILRRAGIKVGVISGGDSLGLRKRVEYLGLDYSFLGNEDKRQAYLAILEEGYTDEEILYMGDEFFDIPLMKKAGFAATVPEVSQEVIEATDYVTRREGGKACVREVIDLLRYAQNIVPEIPDFD